MRETATAAILDAVEEVANERGIDAASIAAIAERAGVAVGTLYNYFPDRDGMFAALFRARRGEMAPLLARVALDAKPLQFDKRLRTYLRGLASVFERQRPFVRLAMAMDATKRGFPKDNSLLTQIQDHVEDIFRAGADEGVIASERTSTFAHMVVGAIRSYKAWAHEHDELFDADLLVDTFLHGVKSKVR